jgi:hypothetical protein
MFDAEGPARLRGAFGACVYAVCARSQTSPTISAESASEIAK